MLQVINTTELNLEGLSPMMQELITGMLTISPQKRLSWKSLFDHPFLREKTKELFITEEDTINIQEIEPDSPTKNLDKLQHSDFAD